MATDHVLATDGSRSRELYCLAEGSKAPMTDEAKKPVWPWSKPLPRFASEAEEVAFWHAHEFESPPEEAWQEVEGPAGGVSRASALRTSGSAGLGAALGAIVGALVWGPAGAAIAAAVGATAASYLLLRRRADRAEAA